MLNTNIFQQIEESVIRKQIPFSCHIDLTYRCNLHCPQCYVVPSDKEELSASEFKCLLDQLAEAKVLYLFLSGGEIFLREDFFEIAEYARKRHFALRLLTNGTLIDEKKADRLAVLNPELVKISLYSADPAVHDAITGVLGSFCKAMNAVRILQERQLPVKLSCLVMRPNWKDYSRVAGLARKLGIEFTFDYRITPRNNGDLTPLQYQIDEKKIALIEKKWGERMNMNRSYPEAGLPRIYENLLCAAARSHCAVNPYGDITPCVQFPLACGNVRNSHFANIWKNSPELKKIRETMVFHLPFCSNCSLRKDCRMCPGLNYVEHKDFTIPSPLVCREAKIIRRIRLEKLEPDKNKEKSNEKSKIHA